MLRKTGFELKFYGQEQRLCVLQIHIEPLNKGLHITVSSPMPPLSLVAIY